MTVKEYYAQQEKEKANRRLGLLILLLLCTVSGIIFIGGFWVGSFIVSDRVAYGVRYRGLDISGLSRADAEHIINRDARQPMSKNALVLVYGKDFWQISPRDIDLRLDTEAILDKALAVGRESNIVLNAVDVIAAAHSGRDIEPVVSYDRKRLEAKVAPIEKMLNRPAKDATLLLMDGGTLLRGKADTGLSLSTDEWYAEIEAELRTLAYPRRINVEPKEAPPAVTNEDLAPIDTLLGSFTLHYDKNSARGKALERAAKALDQKIFRTGSKLSFNALMKEHFTGTNKGSYTGAEQHALDILASCLYGSALHGGFMIAEREAGDGKVGVPGVPAGFVAFAHGYKEDLVIRNRFDHNAYILTYAKDGMLTVDILGAGKDLAGAEVSLLIETVDDPIDPEYAFTTITRRYTHSGTEILRELIGEDRMKKTETVPVAGGNE